MGLDDEEHPDAVEPPGHRAEEGGLGGEELQVGSSDDREEHGVAAEEVVTGCDYSLE